ncbi:MAG: transposase [Pseudomonadales bacterium]|nr:transposase [Pseudomonadales bacterium]MCP5331078.1 transposase [Pseudomonadales bacterium]MCP5343541.1 transposase [Pseudomonadales bacterium]
MSQKLRIGRYSEPERIYLVTVVCAHRRRFFVDPKTGRIPVHIMKALSGDAETLCYVIMPDHIHWLLALGVSKSLQKLVQQMKSLSTKSLHTSAFPGEQIWQKGFHDRALRREEDVRQVARYVIANPLRAGLVRSLREYPLWDAKWL